MTTEARSSPTRTTRPEHAWRGPIARAELDARVLGRLDALGAELSAAGRARIRRVRDLESRLGTWLRHHFVNDPSPHEERPDRLTPEQQIRNVHHALAEEAWRHPHEGQVDACRQIAGRLDELIRSYLAGTLGPLPIGDDRPSRAAGAGLITRPS